MASIRRTTEKKSARRASPPASWARWVLAIVLLIAAAYGYAWWQANKLVDEIVASTAATLDIRHATVVLGPTGRIGVHQLTLRAAGAGEDGASLRIGQAVLEAGDPMWMWRRLFLGPAAPPDRLRAHLHDYSLAPGVTRGDLVDRYVLFPFDLAGCDLDWSPDTRVALGMESAISDADLRIERSGEEADVRLRMTSHGVADLNLDLKLDGLSSPLLAQALPAARLRGARLSMTDYGFAVARNRVCAEKLMTGEAEAIARHVAGVVAWFEARQAKPASPLVEVYRQLVSKGGQLELSLRPRQPVPLREFDAIPLRDFSTFFGGTARIEGLPPATLAIVSLGPREMPPMDAPAANPSLVALSQAVEAAAPVPGTTPEALRFGIGQVLDFENLESLLGARIEIATDIGTTRVGTLTRYTRAGIDLTLDPAAGGFTLSVSRDSVRRIVLRSNPPLAPAPKPSS